MKALLDHISGLTTGQGWNRGRPFTIFPWERRFLAGTFGRAFVQGDAALSVARGAGKTTLISAIAKATLDGPLIEEQAETVIVAPSLSQARITFGHVKRFMGADLDDSRTWRVWDNAQQSLIEHKRTGQVLRCAGADPRRLHGLAPALLIVDEPAQFSPNTAEETYSVLRTAMGKIPGSRMVALGTRPLETLSHFFNDLLTEADYSQIHAAGKDDPPFQKASWAKACPSLRSGMPSLLAEIKAEADRAKKNPSLLPSFKALRLNLGTAPVARNHVLDAETWQAAESSTVERAGPHVLALDLGDGAAQSAAAGYWRRTGRLEALAAFPGVPHSLKERGLRDGVAALYARCEERGELFTTPGRAVDVGLLLRRVLASWGRPVAIVADRYRETDLRQALDAVHFPQAALILRGQGFKDGAEDVRLFRRGVLDGEVQPLPSLLLRAAFAEAVTLADPAGNEKLAKGAEGGRRKRARDDAAAAAILAVAEGARRWPAVEKTRKKRRLRHAVVG